jgi:hypothetical protein
VHANCLSGSHRGRWRVRLQVRASNGRLVNVMRDTGREPSRTGMHRVTASLGRTLDTVRFRRAYGRPPNRDDSKTGRARCSSQPSPGTCAPAKSPSFSMCHQRRSAAGHRRAGCPTSAPWAATDATPTPRSGPCWRPCPSHPRPTSRAPRLTTAASLLSVARWPFGIALRSIGVVSNRGTADFLRARENRGGRMTCDAG